MQNMNNSRLSALSHIHMEITIMKKMSIICLILASLLGGCTSYMYGVPQETWDRMSEPERIEAMGVYEREQQARRQAAEERARRKAAARGAGTGAPSGTGAGKARTY